jgi:hypothetical protein
MDDKLLFVQFPHPGKEHEPDDGLVKGWNNRPHPHRRKFLKQAGKYLAVGKVVEGEMLFWGEWEPESKVERKINASICRGPRFVYTPYYVVPKSYDGLENTDPFVFGEQFHYTVCKQRTFAQLRRLSPGSVILFGSCESHAFVLDTVFVVGSQWIDHAKSLYRSVLKGKISQEYEEVTILPWYQEPCAETKSCNSAESEGPWRLYFGATYDKPFHGMYSFFPCQPYDARSEGFARPEINLPDQIKPKQNTGVKYSVQSSLDEMKLLWGKVADQVKDQGLVLGIHADMPERRLADVS